ncbi:MAG: TolC family protein [Pirellulales bacterium]|nr:TolC family protein [Pirellulales bacterium]
MSHIKLNTLVTISLVACVLGCAQLKPRKNSIGLPAKRLAPVETVNNKEEIGSQSGVSEIGVQLASFQEELDPGLLLNPKGKPKAEFSPDAAEILQLSDVILSVEAAYPLLETALLERDVADGKQLAARGEFDLALKAYTTATPEGFYETYRNGVAFNQPLFDGGYAFSGYKIGDGNFEPWFGERETNEGGEFSAGFGIPLLKDKLIDKRREALFKAELQREAVEPAVQTQLLLFVRAASETYWGWVAAGQALQAQRQLLELAKVRVGQIEARVEAEDLAPIARINNEQLIAARETKVIASQRKLQQAAIKLSLFLRDAQGSPLVPDESLLPREFPMVVMPRGAVLDQMVDRAIDLRPEFAELDLLAEQYDVELAQASNMLLPKLDAQLRAAKDVGGQTSAKGDKTPFELEIGLYGEVPLQRREARGKINVARGKLAQIQAKHRFLADKVAAQVQDVLSALQAALEQAGLAQKNVSLAQQTLELGREQFDAGDVDLIQLNIYEQSVADAQFQLIDAQATFFAALAEYYAALAIDPLEGDSQ